ncbi:MAG: hypothetical protein VB133_12710 [Anaeromusa sp.]|uniref:hypothetical protein n=1 Tax=Anaeromusa sp. TaxID=1872520 RepID=UPI002B1EA8E9|nr:hypothetical protein [Anaeromusa sp.]MEA4835987.1 hypothetical protein [Anaeromusa sp.]
MIVDKETITIRGIKVTITTVETSNTANRYYASSSYKNIDGAGCTVEEAKKKCINATELEIAFEHNRKTK